MGMKTYSTSVCLSFNDEEFVYDPSAQPHRDLCTPCCLCRTRVCSHAQIRDLAPLNYWYNCWIIGATILGVLFTWICSRDLVRIFEGFSLLCLRWRFLRILTPLVWEPRYLDERSKAYVTLWLWASSGNIFLILMWFIYVMVFKSTNLFLFSQVGILSTCRGKQRNLEVCVQTFCMPEHESMTTTHTHICQSSEFTLMIMCLDLRDMLLCLASWTLQ